MAAISRPSGRWIPIVYYYLATVVGLVITLVGLIIGLQGLAHAVFPELSDEVRFSHPPTVIHEPAEGVKRAVPAPARKGNAEQAQLEASHKKEAIRRARLGGFSDAIEGLIAAAVGMPVFIWHLRQARRRDTLWFGGGSLPTVEEPPQ